MPRQLQWVALIRAGAVVVEDAVLSKLAGGLYKPDGQTMLPPPQAYAFLTPLPIRALPGVGNRTEQALQAMGVATVGQLRALTMQALSASLGDRAAASLHAIARGLDDRAVIPNAPPKAITAEDSFKSCAGWAAVGTVLKVLLPDLLSRLEEEWGKRRRLPETLTVRWRAKGAGYYGNRTGASGAMPPLDCITGGPRQTTLFGPRAGSCSDGGGGGGSGGAGAPALHAASASAVAALERQCLALMQVSTGSSRCKL
ncbi:hypothetical protein FOA52_006278 [Chlamydomonas sp. UWO 241]|nr:hypothetical protein FOA52_006278 [Chlamydomonas sp. UWO 241]